ncbi:SUMF1/EgtB/PvdO family nonheme iron enzyme [Arsenicibacter rosenii]|uniref:Sulfatase-modifying factor enzyme-like domain-containing protein n=1 Tax=Arsenicibacter rosenii TaxID=1750698 RepID=A0A1S2VQN9_9BACT|nr:SUMF1/EgtB/PvdO family nonheme iron enzyme [Arsenicibacter rosenii]OIN60486.1 hypothetical protein BLX24_06615 [Arsenicibacter rosenii]
MKTLLLALGLMAGSTAQAQPVRFDQQPVSNKEWAAFLQFARKDPALSKTYTTLVPDQWEKTTLTRTNAEKPVTGVSWQQAETYCRWRSAVATYRQTHNAVAPYQAMEKANATAKTQVIYRLPTSQEWETLASRFNGENIGFRCVQYVKRNGII